MDSTKDGSPAEQLLHHVNYKYIAIRANTTAAVAHAVVGILSNRAGEHVPPTYNQQHLLRLLVKKFRIVARNADVNQLAAVSSTSEDNVRRILAVILAPIQMTPVQTQQNAPPPTTLRQLIPEWPHSIPEHASRLRQVFDRLSSGVLATDGPTVVVPLDDIRVLQDSLKLLDGKLTAVYGNLLDRMPVQQRPEFATESWYTNRCRSGLSRDTTREAGVPLDGDRCADRTPANGGEMDGVAAAGSIGPQGMDEVCD